MKRSFYSIIMTFVIGLVLIPGMVYAQSQQTTTKAPPIEQPLVREGNFAVKLVSSLSLGTTEDEVEAENLLSDVGITPRNGWIADYPVTPDIMGEIRQSVIDAVNSKKLSMNEDEALQKVREAKADVGLQIKPYASGEPHDVNPDSTYPETSVITNYYYNQGPPIVTYYAPPPDYYYLYSWVPYPFWWYDFWFPGYFILNDFHRPFHFHHRNFFISNHFNDFRHHRVFRIDPVDRFHGRTYAGIGAPRTGRYISHGVRNGATTVFNRNRINPPSSGKTFRSPSGSRSFRAPSGGKSFSHPSGGRSFKAPSGGGSFRAPSGSKSFSQPSGGRSSGPSGGGHQRR
jgi:hypothetical protein